MCKIIRHKSNIRTSKITYLLSVADRPLVEWLNVVLMRGKPIFLVNKALIWFEIDPIACFAEFADMTSPPHRRLGI